MSSKDLYRKHCEHEPSIPIFSKDWWLDAVCGDSWDVCLVEKGGVIVASMPYYKKKRYGFTALTQPTLTQNLGPWLRPSNAKTTNRLAQEKDLLNDLIAQLPPFGYFQQNWHHSQTNWLPFYWQGFNQTTRYTYTLPILTDLELVWSGFRENIRTDIRKASSRFNLNVRTDLNIDDFLALNLQTYERQKKRLPYDLSFVKHLDKVLDQKISRRIFIAEDDKGLHHAGVYIIWDSQTAYYLMGGGNPELRASGATSLCMWEAIKFASTVSACFDFEGSMIEPVERFFRAFGAIQTPYFAISKTPSRILRTAMFLRKEIKE